MTQQQIECVACEGTFTVDDEQEESRCLRCGSKYAAPWDDPELLRSPVQGVGDDPRPGGQGSRGESTGTTDTGGAASDDDQLDRAEALTVEGGATVRITIDIIPE